MPQMYRLNHDSFLIDDANIVRNTAATMKYYFTLHNLMPFF
jgi:hypothetical protein